MRCISLSLLFAAAVLSGCAAYTSAPPGRAVAVAPDPIPADAWPARNTSNLDQEAKSTPSRIYRLVLDGSKSEEEIDPNLLRQVRRPVARVDFCQPYGQGLLRAVRSGWTFPSSPTIIPGVSPHPGGSPSVGFGPTGSGGRAAFSAQLTGIGSAGAAVPYFRSLRFVSHSTLADPPVDSRVQKLFLPSLEVEDRVFHAAGAGVRVADRDKLAVLYEGVPIRIIEPPSGPVRGLIVHLPGLGSSQYEQPLIDQLNKSGWAIVRITTPRVWWYDSRSYTINSEADVEPAAIRIASVVDDVLAEPAYAAEAALEYLKLARPDIPQSPLVVIGCSAGALAAPAIAARLHDRVSAAVLIGGGANLLRISQTSDLTDGGIRVVWPEGQDYPAWRERLYCKYLERSRLDPYSTARYLLDRPVLNVLADFDSTVPADCGALLQARLGHPDHVAIPLGHRLMFWSLETQVDRITSWVEKWAKPTSPAGSANVAMKPGRAPQTP